MKNLFLFLAVLVSTQSMASGKPVRPKETAKLRYSYEFLLEKVLEKKKQAFRPEIPVPSLNMASKTPLKVFQDAIEAQWGMRPDHISNAYAMASNMIFIYDDADYYERTERCMDDSVVHELVHYIQDKYLHWDFNDESLEWDAVEVQTEFRKEFCQN